MSLAKITLNGSEYPRISSSYECLWARSVDRSFMRSVFREGIGHLIEPSALLDLLFFWRSNFWWSSPGRKRSLRQVSLSLRNATNWSRRLKILCRSSHRDLFNPTHCFRRKISKRKPFCFDSRPLIWDVWGLREFCEMQVQDVICRWSDHVILWISHFRERRRLPSRHVSGKSRVRIVKLWVSLFVSSFRCGPPCAWKHGLAKGSSETFFAYKFLTEDAVGPPGADGSTKNVSWQGTRVPCVRLLESEGFPHELGKIKRWLDTWNDPQLLNVSSYWKVFWVSRTIYPIS